MLAFAAQFGLEPAEVALVGDTLHDLKAACAAWAVAIGVASGFLSEEELAPFADYVLADIMALPALLRELAEP